MNKTVVTSDQILRAILPALKKLRSDLFTVEQTLGDGNESSDRVAMIGNSLAEVIKFIYDALPPTPLQMRERRANWWKFWKAA